MKKLYLVLIVLIVVLAIVFYFKQSKKSDAIKKATEITEINKKEKQIDTNKKVVEKKVAETKKADPLDILKKDCKSKSPSKEEEYFCLAKSGIWITENAEILGIINSNGWSVAHSLAQFNKKFNPTENILYIRDKNGLSVAHVLAQYNSVWSTKDVKILSLKNNAQESVAHFLVTANKIDDIVDEEVLSLTTSYGVSVRDLAKKRK